MQNCHFKSHHDRSYCKCKHYNRSHWRFFYSLSDHIGPLKLANYTKQLIKYSPHYSSLTHINCLASIGWQLERVSCDAWWYMTMLWKFGVALARINNHCDMHRNQCKWGALPIKLITPICHIIKWNRTHHDWFIWTFSPLPPYMSQNFHNTY